MRIPTLISVIAFAAACGGGGGASETTPVTPPPSGNVTIGALQGIGSVSPRDGQSVTVEGIVTGDFQDGDADETRNLRGFFIQDTSPDSDTRTSDGVFVFDGSNPTIDVNVGDIVEVEGTVAEFFGETQISPTAIRIIGSGSIEPLAITLPVEDVVSNSDGELLADLERYEGMLVSFPGTLTITDLYTLGRFGSIGMSAGGRLFQFTNGNPPDVNGYSTYKEAIARRSIVLDDGLREQNPTNLRYLRAGTSPGYSVRVGDTVTGLSGNLRYSRGSGGSGDEAWRLVPTDDPAFTSMNPRPGAPAVDGALRVGAFNVLNFFSTLDSGQNNCGPRGNAGCRGADTAEELSRQLAKTTTALYESGADIMGLTELENNATASLEALVDALNARAGTLEFSYIDTGVIHEDVIKAGLIYRASAVSPVGPYVLLDRSVDSRFNDDRNRPALAQAFALSSSGARVSVVVNHLKSKGSSCDADGDPNLDDGQGNCNLTRTNAAAALADWVATDPTGSGDDDYLIIGDMNAYFAEDPIEALRNGGLTDLLANQPNPYSYLFDGQSGALDHAFATASLATQVKGAIEWHINTDEPSLLDYNLEFARDPELFDPGTPYRASDHDPIIIGLDLTN
jgi:predicted extracellular nuclease